MNFEFSYICPFFLSRIQSYAWHALLPSKCIPPPPTHTLTHIHIERKRNNTSPPPPKDHPKISTDLVEQRFDGLHAPPELADAGVEGLGLLCGARAGRERDADFLAFFWGGLVMVVVVVV